MVKEFQNPSDEVDKAWAFHETLEKLLANLWDRYGDDFAIILQIDSNKPELPEPPDPPDDDNGIPW